MPRVAVVGASSDRNKFGNKALRAYVRQGWEVFPVHHKEPEIEGIPTVASLDGLEGIDRVTFYVPPAIGIGMLLGADHASNGERTQRLARIGNIVDLETDRRQRL